MASAKCICLRKSAHISRNPPPMVCHPTKLVIIHPSFISNYFSISFHRGHQMAKRAAAGQVKVNMSQEIREIVKANHQIRGPELITALKEKFPGVALNENSIQVAFANVRKRMGLSRTVAKRPVKRAARRTAKTATAPSPVRGTVSFKQLQAAKDYLAACDDSLAIATNVLQQLAELRK